MLNVENLVCNFRKNPMGISCKPPKFGWKIISDSVDILQKSYEIQVSLESQIIWSSGVVNSSQSANITYDGGNLLPQKAYSYRVKITDNHGEISPWSDSCTFETGLANWSGKWIMSKVDNPSFVKTINISKKVTKARVYITALGLYNGKINGVEITTDKLTPGWTSYNKRLQYQTYDVTNLLKNGENRIEILNGVGWYKGNLVWADHKDIYGDKTAVLMELHLWNADGTQEIVTTDSSWNSSKSPIIYSEFYHGETYDARVKNPQLQEVLLLNKGYDNLVEQECEAVREIETISPISKFTAPNGDTLLDMGQNMVGYMRFKVRGNAGDTVVLQHAEVLDKEGNFYLGNLRNAKSEITYILSGDGEEIYSPYFSFQGFRYVRICQYPGDVNVADFTGVVIHSNLEQTGHFSCSNNMVNQLFHNIIWGQKGNFVDVPTDCPQRDERLGWTGDAQVFCRTAAYNMNVKSFFDKYLNDLAADQFSSGSVPHIIPDAMLDGAGGSAAWGDAAVIIPWTMYLCYGDKEVLQRQYSSMKQWVDYIYNEGTDKFLWNTGGHFGDWLGLDAKEGSYVGSTDKYLIATAFYGYSAKLLSKTAKILGKEDDGKKYEILACNIANEYENEFISPNGRLTCNTQTAYALTIMFDLANAKHMERLSRDFVALIEESDCHLTTGFVGTPYLALALTKIGRVDIAYKIFMQQDYPSWLYQVTKGATTIWEHWDSLKVDGSFWSDNMNSFNHYSYGAIAQWMYSVVAGIDTDGEEIAYKHSIIAPQLGGGLTWVRGDVDTIYGKLQSAWFVEEDNVKFVITVPHNTRADFVVPKCCENAGEIKCLGSGEHTFIYKLLK